MTAIRPMLAAKADLDKLDYPLYVAPKLDGVRALVIDGVVMSRSMKPIPNLHVQRMFGDFFYDGYDGELIVGDPTAPDVYRKTNSAVMTRDDEPEVTFHVFDTINPALRDRPFSERRNALVNDIAMHPSTHGVCHVPHLATSCQGGLAEVEALYVEEGFEGIILRHPDRPYKFGRSTVKEQGMLKLKRFEDSEAEVLEVIELQRNLNEAKANELGYASRSSHKENKVAGDTMGALRVRDVHTGVEFQIGTGFTQAERDVLWTERDSTAGCLVKYKFFAVGVKDLPRHPVFLGFRDRRDT